MSRVFRVRKGVGGRASRWKGRHEPWHTEEKMQPNGRMVMSLHLLMGGVANRFHLAFQLGGIGVAT